MENKYYPNLFKKGKIIKKVPQEEIVNVLKQEILKMI